MLNGWSDVFQAPGSRTTGSQAQSYVITGPHWHGDQPGGVIQYQSATNLVWIVGRTHCTGTADGYERVHAFQDQLSLVPLSAYGKGYSPPAGRADPGIDMETPTKDQVIGMDGAAYFTLLAELMKDNPPTAADTAIAGLMAKIGLIPGRDCDAGTLDPAVAKVLARAPQMAPAPRTASCSSCDSTGRTRKAPPSWTASGTRPRWSGSRRTPPGKACMR
jgi:hypothetical protein